ncbi:MAG: PAS domain-containing sensor histidine kinase, partial [Planctomycetota bacterium]
PLAGIHGAMQILRRKLHPGPEEQKVFEDVAAEISRLDRLVSDLLRFGRPPAPRLSRVELGLFLKEWAERMDREAAARHARVNWSSSTQAATRIDSILLEQVLRNLFENALEAAPGSCRIEVEMTRANGQAHITFRDDGPGVPPEIRNRVIEPFFTTKPRGSGLGLAICRRHLHSMGGSLTLLAAEKGAAFRLSLPLASKGKKMD